MFSIFKLGEIAEIIAGGDKPTKFSEDKSELNTIPVFANAEKNNGLQGYTNTPKIFEFAVTVAARGSNVGFVAIRKEPFFPIVRLLSLIPNREILDVDYLFYNLKLNRQTGTGSGQPQITIPQISSKSISLPSLPIQQKIASVLSSLDDKIELNNRINAELEAMAKTLYDYWFVQFDFPNEQGKPYKTSGGAMVWNEELKREVPEGWEVKKLGEWINNDKSGDWGKESPEGNYIQKVYCIRGADINGLNGTGSLKTPERYILEKNLHKILDPADLIVEISGGSPTQSTGRLAFVTGETLKRFDAPIICSNFCKAITLKNKKYLYNFVYHWKSIYDDGILFGYEGKTSGIKNLLFESFVSTHLTVLPKKEVVDKFYDNIAPIHSKKQTNLIENQKLSSLRDWLLPMLMNGQVKVV
jgi:type I restriction enzyme S subunit